MFLVGCLMFSCRTTSSNTHEVCVVGEAFSLEADLKRPPWFLREERDGGCSAVRSGTSASSWTQKPEYAAYGASDAVPQGFVGSSLGLALLHQGVGGIDSTQHLSDRLLQPEHYRCLLPQAAGPPQIQHSQFSQGWGLPRNRIRGKRSVSQDCMTRNSERWRTTNKDYPIWLFGPK